MLDKFVCVVSAKKTYYLELGSLRVAFVKCKFFFFYSSHSVSAYLDMFTYMYSISLNSVSAYLDMFTYMYSISLNSSLVT